MKSSHVFFTVFAAVVMTLCSFPPILPANTNPPASPVKLIFIHHSTGGAWLSDPTQDNAYGGLGIELRDNNYYVSATNYCWGLVWTEYGEGVGSYTDIVHWPEWFTGTNRDTILNDLYTETGQHFTNCWGDNFGEWSRLSADPGGENEIIMFKSCFPNSDLYGNPDDPAYAQPNGHEFSVSNAKAVYNDILSYFETRQDKLFIAVTAPPMSEKGYEINDGSTPAATRAANARAFTGWLVNGWLDSYAYDNVAVFDYYNILTSNGGDPDTNDAGQESGNHHRWWNGQVQHIQTVSNNYSAYPTYVGTDWADDHPRTAGHLKATAEFVPLLNYWYNRWKGTVPAVSAPSAVTGQASSITSAGAALNGSVNPNGAETTYYFEYGPTTAYGSQTTAKSAGSGTGPANVSESVAGLEPETEYHYRLAAVNSEGTTYGADATFTTQTVTIVTGNIDASPDGLVNLADAVTALRICAGISTPGVLLAAEVNGDGRIGLAEAVFALQTAAELRNGSSSGGDLVQPADFEYLGAFRLPGGDTPPETFAYGGNAMTVNPNGNSGAGSLYVMGHDRQDGGLPDGGQVAEISIPIPVVSNNPGELNTAAFIQNFSNVAAGYFTDLVELPRIGMAYLDHPTAGAKIHLGWGQHHAPDTPHPTYAWFNPELSNPDLQGLWYIGDQDWFSINGYLFEIPASWADVHVGGRCLGTGRAMDGGWGGMGPSLIAYKPWETGGSPAASETHLSEITLLLYEDTQDNGDIVQNAVEGHQHPDEWEGGAWITTASGKSAVLFAANKGTGAKYWYGYQNPAGPEYPCVNTDAALDFNACRMADGSPCPEADMVECDGHTSAKGWWCARFTPRLVLFDPSDLAEVAAGTMESWEPQPYANLDIEEHLLFNPDNVDIHMLGDGIQRRYLFGDAAYDRVHDRLYVLELFADGAKPAVHVWRVL